MQTLRKRRLYFVIFMLTGVGLAVAVCLFALRKNINLYLTPQQVLSKHLQPGHTFRLGGLVVRGSVKHIPNSLKVSFVLTDFHRTLVVNYNGILPSLFHDGQGIVAQGQLNINGVFVADQVLAKHDANYHPPEIPNQKVHA